LSGRSQDVAPASTGEALLELLASRGVEYLLAGGSGTDFPPIVEGFAKRLTLGQPVPKPVAVDHELTTVSMARDYEPSRGLVIWNWIAIACFVGFAAIFFALRFSG